MGLVVIKLRGQVPTTADKECGGADSEQPQSRGFRHGQCFALEGQSNRTEKTRGKGALRSARRDFDDVLAAIQENSCAVATDTVTTTSPHFQYPFTEAST